MPEYFEIYCGRRRAEIRGPKIRLYPNKVIVIAKSYSGTKFQAELELGDKFEQTILRIHLDRHPYISSVTEIIG
jgi:hypothetical protein